MAHDRSDAADTAGLLARAHALATDYVREAPSRPVAAADARAAVEARFGVPLTASGEPTHHVIDALGVHGADATSASTSPR